MSLIPAILHGIYAYKREKERLAKQAEGGDGGGGKLNFGPGLSFDEANGVADSFRTLGMNLMEDANAGETPRIRRPPNDYPTYKPGRSE